MGQPHGCRQFEAPPDYLPTFAPRAQCTGMERCATIVVNECTARQDMPRLGSFSPVGLQQLWAFQPEAMILEPDEATT